MSDLSLRSSQPTLFATEPSTSSPVSEGGPSPSGLQDGQTTDRSGRRVARARPSQRPVKRSPVQDAKERTLSRALDELASSFAADATTPGTPTSDTSGQRYGDSPATVDLQKSLESRCRARMEGCGSPEFEVHWKSLGMVLGVSICVARSSARRTSGSDSGGQPAGWPTPNAIPEGRGGLQSNPEKALERQQQGHMLNLDDAACLAGWPTPMAGSPATADYNEAGNNDSSRKTVALLAGWNTPRATDGSKGGPNQSGGALPADAALCGWATPAARDFRSEEATDQFNAERWAHPRGKPLSAQALTAACPSGSGAITESSGVPIKNSGASRPKLNPAFSAWIMGFPTIWVLCGWRAFLSPPKRSRAA